MDDILAKKNRHLFLEEKDNVGNSFIANVNTIVDDLDNIDAVANDLGRIDIVADNIDNVNTVAENMDDINATVENLDKIDQFNDNLIGLLESLLEQLGEDGNAWLVRLTELGESILATTSAFNYAVTTTLTQDIASGATLTLPYAMKYRVGTHMLMVSWNGTVCYIGDQYNEVGNFNQWSTTISMNVPLKTGDKIQFRVVALADAAAFIGQIDSVIGNTSVVATGSTENRTLANRFADIVNVKDFGAKGDGVTDDREAIQAAITAADGSVVLYPSNHNEDYSINLKNVYAHDEQAYNKSSGILLVSGDENTPTNNPYAILFVEKNSSATRTGEHADEHEWDNGAIYAQLNQLNGSAYGAAITGYARSEAENGGQIVGVHGRGSALASDSQVWGGWFYGASSSDGCQHVIGIEVNIRNISENGDPGWNVALGGSRGIVISTADNNSVPGMDGLYIGCSSGSAGWHTGIKIGDSAIEPSISRDGGISDNEAIYMPGAKFWSKTYGGIRFGDAGNSDNLFSYGISFSEASFTANCAMIFGEGQRIKVGQSTSVSTYIELSKDNNYVDFENLNIYRDGVKVLTTRRTGWSGSSIGTPVRTPFNASTVTVEELAQRFIALIQDLKAHGLIGE